ncbi:hypothetical protein BX616_007556 [Lobosporangium transversale]|nr:hypothetical protein BX616_007556 [Lobosporangium transversale]
MPKCSFDYCSKGYLSPDRTLSHNEKEHVRKYHKETSCVFGFMKKTFRFDRQESHDNRYVCYCGKTFTVSDSLKAHATGFIRTKTEQPACTEIVKQCNDTQSEIDLDKMRADIDKAIEEAKKSY